MQRSRWLSFANDEPQTIKYFGRGLLVRSSQSCQAHPFNDDMQGKPRAALAEPFDARFGVVVLLRAPTALVKNGACHGVAVLLPAPGCAPAWRLRLSRLWLLLEEGRCREEPAAYAHDCSFIAHGEWAPLITHMRLCPCNLATMQAGHIFLMHAFLCLLPFQNTPNSELLMVISCRKRTLIVQHSFSQW
eukprot:scaffold185042_cov17-Tisochrysis_lutea.AAC.1